MAKIKICGLRRDTDISYVNTLKPDYIGFILTPGFRRSIDYDNAAMLRKKLDKSITAVGVFVDDDMETIHKFVKNGVIDIVQLHGSESPYMCSKIDAPVIKALKPCDFDKIKEYEPFVDYFLFDSGMGTGRIFDWSKIPEPEKPFFLAGGLDESNIKAAMDTIAPYALDVSSSVETDGIKNFSKIKRIMEIVRNE